MKISPDFSHCAFIRNPMDHPFLPLVYIKDFGRDSEKQILQIFPHTLNLDVKEKHESRRRLEKRGPLRGEGGKGGQWGG
jgi:hypothetical protein